MSNPKFVRRHLLRASARHMSDKLRGAKAKLRGMAPRAKDKLRNVAPQAMNKLAPVIAVLLLFVAMGGTWRIAHAAPPASTIAKLEDSDPERPIKKSAKDLSGKLNINTASEEQLMMLPTVGPAKAERIVTWRKKNGGFKRTADLRRVKGFGYKTFKRLEPFIDIKGESTLK